MADIDFKNGVNVDTAFVDGHKVKLIAVPDGSLELPISANDEYGYVVDANGKKHRVLLVTFLEGDPDFKSAPNADTAYMTVNSQKVKVRLGAKLNGTQYLSDSANVNDCYTEDDDGNKHRTILVSEPTGTLELSTRETDDSAYVIDDNGKKHKVRLFAVLAGGTTTVEVTVSGIPPFNLLGAVADSLTSLKAFGGTEQRSLPQGYQQLVSLTTDNASYFDADYLVKSIDVDVTVDAAMTLLASGPNMLWGFMGSASNLPRWGVGSYQNYWLYGANATTTTGNADADRHITKASLYYNDNDTPCFRLTLDGAVGAGSAITSAETITSNTLSTFIGARNNYGTAGNFNPSTFYSFKIEKAGVLVVNMVPAKRLSDNVVGFYDTVRDRFFTNAGTGTITAGTAITPTPSDPMDIYCNNGKISVLDHTNWTIKTNPDSEAGQGIYINTTNGKWYSSNDRGAGAIIPITVGKKYTMLINKKTLGLGNFLRYGQSATSTPSGQQLVDWYAGVVQDGQIVSFTAKKDYFVFQMGADFVESGGIDEAIEVIEAAGDNETIAMFGTSYDNAYDEVPYLEADGTGAYIDTGFKPDSNTKVEVKFALTSALGTQCLIGGRNSSTNPRNSFAIWAAVSSKPRFDYGSNQISPNDGTGTTEHIVIKQGRYNTLDGVAQSANLEETFACNYNMALFCMNTGDVITNNSYINGKVYYCKIWDNGTLVRDFVPVRRRADGELGMYDKVNGVFYTNAGTGDFTTSYQTATANNLFAVNTYKDVQEIITGATTHNIGVRVLDGTEDWGVATSSGNRVFVTNLIGASPYPLICTHFVNGEPTTDNIIYIRSGTQILLIRYDTPSDLAAFKSWLAAQYAAGTPVIIVYQLATPYSEVAPIAQSMTVVDGDNTVSLTQQGMTPLTLEATYTAGVSVTITEIENANIGNDVDVVIA